MEIKNKKKKKKEKERKAVHEEWAISFTHSNEDISGSVPASRDIKDCAENLPSFYTDPSSTLSPPALCSWRLICMESRKGFS